MKHLRVKTLQLVITALLATLTTLGHTADSNTYQVSGPILSMTATTVTVLKDGEKWEIAKDQATPVRGGELKVASK